MTGILRIASLAGTQRKCLLRVDLTRSPSRRRMAALCALGSCTASSSHGVFNRSRLATKTYSPTAQDYGNAALDDVAMGLAAYAQSKHTGEDVAKIRERMARSQAALGPMEPVVNALTYILPSSARPRRSSRLANISPRRRLRLASRSPQAKARSQAA
jgi:hypothetical protein